MPLIGDLQVVGPTGPTGATGPGADVPFVGATGPSDPTDGMLWWDTDDATVVTIAQAAFVEPTTATPEQICDALIAAGLMEAS